LVVRLRAMACIAFAESELAALAAEADLAITVCHFPPGPVPATLRLERPGLGLDHRRFASTLSVIRQRLTRIARAIALLFQRPSPKSFCRWRVLAGKRRDFRFRVGLPPSI